MTTHTDAPADDLVERLEKYRPINEWGAGEHHVILDEAAARIRSLEAQRDEAQRRRDAWRKKAEGYDAVCLALREKVGSPWPPHMSRLLWAGIAAAEKTRADRAEAQRDEAVGLLRELMGTHDADALSDDIFLRCEAFLDSLKEGRHG